MNELEFSVPGNPLSQNRAYRRSKQGRMFMSDEARAFKEQIALIAKCARPDTWDTSTKWFEVWVTCYFDSQRPDVDGPCKLALDAMEHVLYENDRQVVKVTMERRVDRVAPRMEVKVRELERV